MLQADDPSVLVHMEDQPVHASAQCVGRQPECGRVSLERRQCFRRGLKIKNGIALPNVERGLRTQFFQYGG